MERDIGALFQLMLLLLLPYDDYDDDGPGCRVASFSTWHHRHQNEARVIYLPVRAGP